MSNFTKKFIGDEQRILEKRKLYDEKRKKMIENGINIPEYRNLILNQFKKNTLKYTKQFYKIAKKNDPIKVLKFVKKNILPEFEKNVYIDDYIKEVCEYLNNDQKESFNILLTYVTGIFITIHSKAFEKKENDLVDTIITEMFIRVFSKINKEILEIVKSKHN